MDRAALSPLLRSFERHLRAENRSERTIDSYLQSARQAETFLAGRGTSLTDAGRADLEAFLGDLLGRRAAATAATRYKVLRILSRWLEEEDEVRAVTVWSVLEPSCLLGSSTVVTCRSAALRPRVETILFDRPESVTESVTRRESLKDATARRLSALVDWER